MSMKFFETSYSCSTGLNAVLKKRSVSLDKNLNFLGRLQHPNAHVKQMMLNAIHVTLSIFSASVTP